MPDDKQVPHLWDALQYVLKLQGERQNAGAPDAAETGMQEDGTYVPTDEHLEQNVKALGFHIGGIAHRLKHKLREEGAWQNLGDPSWPSNYAGDDHDHIYKSGAYPPALMVWPPTEESWAEMDKPTRRRLHKELAVWGETAAGRATLPKEMLDKMNDAIARAQESTDVVRRAKLDWDMAKLCSELASRDPERWE